MGAVALALTVKSITFSPKKARQRRYRPMAQSVPAREEVATMGKEEIARATEELLGRLEQEEDEEVLVVWREAAVRARDEFSTLL